MRLHPVKLRAIQLLICLFLLPVSLQAQYEITGQLDLLMRNTDANDYSNKTFKKFSNFDFVRTRIFFDAKVAENATVFSQVLIDNSSFQLYGAYLRLSELAGPGVNLHVGLIPNTIGTWGPRTYSNQNPLIGVPLMYIYHTALTLSDFQRTPEDLLAYRGNGNAAFGLPMMYDACWNTGVDFFGSIGMFDWSLAALSGAVSAPAIQREKEIPQFTGKLGLYFSPVFNLSFSGFAGPYIAEIPLEYAADAPDPVDRYMNYGGGISASYAAGYLQLFAEAFACYWEHPFLGDLGAYSGYIDGKYKLAPQWYIAARAETLRFSEVNLGPGIGRIDWDYPLNKFEFGVGHNVNRAVTMKLVGQIVVSPDEDSLDDEIVALQIATEI